MLTETQETVRVASVINSDVLVIGAGISGLAAARELRASGLHPVILERSRGVSGRCATRRWDGIPVDHGAQYFTARTPLFQEQLRDWLDAGVCFEWSTKIHRWSPPGLVEKLDPCPRYAGRGGMSALGKAMEHGLDVRRNTRVDRLEQSGDLWVAHGPDLSRYEAPHVIVSAPIPQTLELLHDADLHADAAARLGRVFLQPCICVALRFPASQVPEWQGIQLDDPILSWIGNDSSKRENPSATVIILHGAPGFSRVWLNRDLGRAADLMTARAAGMLGAWILKSEARFVHLWKYSLVERGVESSHYLEVAPGCTVVGDAFVAPRIEGAWLSGHAAGAALAKKLSR
jgi:renalase